MRTGDSPLASGSNPWLVQPCRAGLSASSSPRQGILVPASKEAGQEFAIGHAAPFRREIGLKVLNDPVQRADRHRLVPRLHRRHYLIILIDGRFDPPV